MTHNNHTESDLNQDLVDKDLQYYLDLIGDYKSPYPDPVIVEHEGVRVVRDDLVCGTKVRGGDLLISRIPQDTIVYCQPRFGAAGPSILDVCKRHGKKVVLFMPSCKQISHHQMVCIERGCIAKFVRIASMKNLNAYAKQWAEENNAYFVPLGLKHELCTAGIIQAALTIPEPEEVWSVISTGVLTRAMQISWPNAKFYATAVARNVKNGEKGKAILNSAPEPFVKPVKGDDVPPFPCILEYDAKVWRYIPKNTNRDILMWNVAKDFELNDETIWEQVNSQREWGDLRDLTNNRSTTLTHEGILTTVG